VTPAPTGPQDQESKQQEPEPSEPEPQRIIERTFFVPQPEQTERRTRITEPLQPIVIVQPGPEIIVNVVPPAESIPNERMPDIEQPPESGRRHKEERTPVNGGAEAEPEQKEFAAPNKNNSPEPIKTIQEPNKNNSPNNSETIRSGELITQPEPATEASPAPSVPNTMPAYKKKGKVGRQRKYEELGIDDVEPVKEVVLFRHQMGRHWPGMSADMQAYYERLYFTRPKKGIKDYDKHKGCWERKERWVKECAG
jgi:hypothetical protein